MTDQNSENFTFEQLSPEEKRRVIAALSMGKLSEDEKKEFARVCSRSRLTEEEKKQIARAFTLSRMTDEERRALLMRKKQQAGNGSAQVQQPAADTVPETAEEEQTSVVHMPDGNRNMPVQDDLPTRAHAVVTEEQTREHRIPGGGDYDGSAGNNTDGEDDSHGDMSVRTTVHSRSHTVRKNPPKKSKRQEEDDEPEEHDTTALTSLLKGVVYIVSVLIVSVFASYAIISVGNDVFAFVKSDEAVTVVIEEDMTTGQVAEMLYANGVIRYPTVYELFIRIKDYSTNYLVGEYEITPSMNYKQLNRTFTYVESTRQQVVITIPEGYTIDQMIDLFLSYGIGTKAGFVDVINNYPFDEFRFLDEMPTLDAQRKYRLEGYLFPDTYFFFTDDAEVAVIHKILLNFQKKITDAYYERANDMGMTMDQVITLASMLQAEGTTQGDFENISSVFHNRLDHPREFPLLQSDATLQYILDKRKTALTAADLKLQSKYNSYLYPGLPPSAICNPGLDAIDCALYPAKTNYYYFLADSRGNTYFSETLEQHEELKKQYIGN